MILKFKPAGRIERDYGQPTMGEAVKTRTEKFRFRVDAKTFPLLSAKKDGEKCYVVIEVMKVGSRVPDHYEADKDPYLELEIQEMAEIPPGVKGQSPDFLKEIGYRVK